MSAATLAACRNGLSRTWIARSTAPKGTVPQLRFAGCTSQDCTPPGVGDTVGTKPVTVGDAVGSAAITVGTAEMTTGARVKGVGVPPPSPPA